MLSPHDHFFPLSLLSMPSWLHALHSISFLLTGCASVKIHHPLLVPSFLIPPFPNPRWLFTQKLMPITFIFLIFQSNALLDLTFTSIYPVWNFFFLNKPQYFFCSSKATLSPDIQGLWLRGPRQQWCCLFPAACQQTHRWYARSQLLFQQVCHPKSSIRFWAGTVSLSWKAPDSS